MTKKQARRRANGMVLSQYTEYCDKMQKEKGGKPLDDVDRALMLLSALFKVNRDVDNAINAKEAGE